MSGASKLYNRRILEISKSPYHFMEMKDPTHVFVANNPLCGDKFTFYLKVEKNKIIKSSFHGFGCAVSKASASVLTEKLANLSLDDLSDLIDKFLIALENEPENLEGDLGIFNDVRDFPERLTCVTLGWNELKNRLQSQRLF